MSGTAPGSRVGSRFGPYVLRRLLGSGGMGEVYEAEDTVKERIVALKLLPAALSGDPVFRGRLRREAHAAGRLQEVHVVPIHDWGEIDGQLYVDMRLIDGTDLHTMLCRSGPLAPVRAVGIVKQVGSALDAAHAAGVTHRDVKPANILVTGDDFACLLDFGIASAATDETLTRDGTTVGTYGYMAPERFTGQEVTHRADIYSLACVLYECLTGSRPYPADSVGVLISSHLFQPIPRPSHARAGLPAGFDDVVARGMAKSAADRYAKAGDLARAAHQALTTAGRSDSAPIRPIVPATKPDRSVPPAPRQHPVVQPMPGPVAPPNPRANPSYRPQSETPAYGPAARAAPSQPGAGPPPGQSWAPAPRIATPPSGLGRGRRAPWILLTAGAILVIAVVGSAAWLGTHPDLLGTSEPNTTPETTTASSTVPTSTKLSTAQAVFNACDALSQSSRAAIAAVNDYVTAKNANSSAAAAKEGPAIAALRRSADQVSNNLSNSLPPQLTSALKAYTDAAGAVADAVSRHASPDDFNGAVDRLNSTKGTALNQCKAADPSLYLPTS